MLKLKELDFETRLKIVRSLQDGVTSPKSISKKFGLSHTDAKNIGPLYDQYGEPGLRDTSMTPNSSLPKIDLPIQEMIITIILNHPHLTTKEVRNLLNGEGIIQNPKPIQHFLTQAGLGTEELRNQYLEELRGLKNSRSTRGLQKFAYNKIVAHDNSDQNNLIFDVDEHHYLLFEITLNPRVEAGKTAALHLFLNLYSLHIEILVIDTSFQSPTIRNENKRFLQTLRPMTTYAKANEFFLWHESLSDDLRSQTKRVFLESYASELLNEDFADIYGDNRLSFGVINEFFEAKIDFKLGFLKSLTATIEDSREYNSQIGNAGRIALDYSIEKIQELVNDYNSEETPKNRPPGSPCNLEINRGTILRESPVTVRSDLIREWLNKHR